MSLRRRRRALNASGVIGDKLRGELGIERKAPAKRRVDEVRARGARQAPARRGCELVDARTQLLGKAKVALDPGDAPPRAANALVDDRGARILGGARQPRVQRGHGKRVGRHARGAR